MKKTFLIIGGAGFIGAQVTKAFQEAGYETVVLDNLSRGFRERVLSGIFELGDVGDPTFLDKLFKKYSFAGVLHFAALADVGESVIHPDIYYQNNIVNTLTLLNCMVKHNVKTLVFSSSSAVYGIPETLPARESDPCNPINPYGRTKLMVEQILADYKVAYGMQSCSLRYFNAAGGDPDKKIPYFRRKEGNLIPIILNNVIDKQTTTVFGDDYSTTDGSCIRDYIHIADLATAHLAAMEKLLAGETATCYNLGVGKGFSVFEVLNMAEKVVGHKIDYKIGKRREGDAPVLTASSEKAFKELGWKPKYSDLETMIQHAWNVMKEPSCNSRK
jgi:UDP-glucose 4-epimerase